MPTRLTKANLQDSVTQHMRTDFARLQIDQTVDEALTSVRERQGEGRIIYFYVVDGDGRLRGVVPTRHLLLNLPDKPISEIMVERVIAIPATASVLDACEFCILHRLLAFPVVDDYSPTLPRDFNMLGSLTGPPLRPGLAKPGDDGRMHRVISPPLLFRVACCNPRSRALASVRIGRCGCQ